MASALDDPSVQRMEHDDWVQVVEDGLWFSQEEDDLVCVRRSYASALVSCGDAAMMPQHRTSPLHMQLPCKQKKNGKIACEEKEDDGIHEESGRRWRKQLVKGGLVKRWIYENIRQEPNSLTVLRPKRDGLMAMTAIDEQLPELLTRESATLNKKKRWEAVRELFHELELAGIATPALAVKPPYGRGDMSPPLECERFIVQATKWVALQSNKVRHRLEVLAARDAVVSRYDKQGVVPWYALDSQMPAKVTAERNKRHGTQRCYFDPMRGSLRAPSRRGALSKREARAFTPGVAIASGAPAMTNNVRAAANGVVNYSVELAFGRAVFLTFVSVAGKIHDTEQVEVDQEKDSKLRYRNKQIVSTRKRYTSYCWVAIQGTDAYVERVELFVRLASTGAWLGLGEHQASSNGRDEVAISLASAGCATLRSDGIFGIECTAVRFRALSWYRSPALRVGAYGKYLCADRGHLRPTLSPKVENDDEAVIYDLYSTTFLRDDDGMSQRLVRTRLLRTHAHKPRRTRGSYRFHRDERRDRPSKRNTFARQIKDATADYDERRAFNYQRNDGDFM